MDCAQNSHEIKHHLTNIFISNNRAICLLCLEEINKNVSRENYNLVFENDAITDHLLSDAHKSKVKSLFMECFPNSMIDIEETNCAEILNSLEFDISLYLGNEPSYVSQIGFNVVCLMCSQKLFEACANEGSIEIMLYQHLQSEQHIRSMKRWTSWIYFLKENLGFVMISQSRVYCSYCKQTIIVINCETLFPVLKSHINHDLCLSLTSEDVEICRSTNKLYQQDDYTGRNLDASLKTEEDKSDYHQQQSSLDVAEVFDKNTLKSIVYLKENCLEQEHNDYLLSDSEYTKNNDHTESCKNVQALGDKDLKESCFENKPDDDTRGSPEVTKESCSVDNEFSSHSLEVVKHTRSIDCGTEENVVDSLETQSKLSDRSSFSSGVRGNYESETESEPTDTEDYVDAYDTLKCPDCGVFIEILNENADFSLQLHRQEHKDLNNVDTDNELAFDANVEYICPLCHDVIPIFNKNIELSTQRHFEEHKIYNEGFGSDERNNVNTDLLLHTFNNIPEPMRKYQRFITLEGNGFFCKLCNCTVPEEDKILNDHLSNPYHEGQYRSLSQNLAMAVVECNNQYRNHQPNEELELLKTLAKKHPLIKKNMQFIGKKGVHYFCLICQKHINHSSNQHTLTLNFMLHLRGSLHENAFKGVEKSSSEKCLVQRVKKDKEPQKQLKHKMTTTMSAVCDKSDEVYLNRDYFKIRPTSGVFLCIICKESIKFSRRCPKLVQHSSSSGHNDILTKNAASFVSNLRLPLQTDLSDHLKNILHSLARLEYLKPHIQFITGNKQGSYCVLCEVKVPTTKKNIEEHIFGTYHRDNSFKMQLEAIKKSKPKMVKDPTDYAKKALAKLLQYSPLIATNFKFVDVMNEHFFCKICCELIKYSTDGKHLKTHLSGADHRKIMNSRRQTDIG